MNEVIGWRDLWGGTLGNIAISTSHRSLHPCVRPGLYADLWSRDDAKYNVLGWKKMVWYFDSGQERDVHKGYRSLVRGVWALGLFLFHIAKLYGWIQTRLLVKLRLIRNHFRAIDTEKSEIALFNAKETRNWGDKISDWIRKIVFHWIKSREGFGLCKNIFKRRNRDRRFLAS